MPTITIVAISHQTGIRLAEVGYLLIAIAGVWFAVAEIPQFKLATSRRIVGALLLVVAGVLLIVATHWGHVG